MVAAAWVGRLWLATAVLRPLPAYRKFDRGATLLTGDIALDEAAAKGIELVQSESKEDCTHMPQSLANALNHAKTTLESACRHNVNGGGSTCDWSRIDSEWDSVAEMSNASIALVAVATLADELGCLKRALTTDVFLNAQAELDALQPWLTSIPDAVAQARVTLAFERLTDWQDELAALGGTLVDKELLFPSNVEYVFNCPQPCMKCSRDHNSVWKAKEEYSFKCFLTGENKDITPDQGTDKVQCEKARRRWTRPWQFKTWCSVPDWKVLAYQQTRVAASITCGSTSILEALKTGQVMSNDVMRTCMLVEQRMSVTINELREYRAMLESASDGVTPTALIHAFSLFLSSHTAEGLAGLRASSEGRPVTDELFDRLVNSSEYTFLLPGVIPEIPCDPPENPRALLMGVFRAISIATAGPLAGLAATWPLVLFSTIWYTMIGIVAIVAGPVVLFFPHTWVGLILFPVINSMWAPAAQEAMLAANKRHAEQPTKNCPQGLLFLGSAKTPICVQAMDYGEARRLDCPDDPDGFGATVTCEQEYNGAPIIRDNFC